MTPSEIDRWASRTFRASSAGAWWMVRLLGTRAGFWQFARIYSYFRWADDVVDAPDRDPALVAAFVEREAALLGSVFASAEDLVSELPGERPAERALRRAIRLGGGDARLRAAVETMWAALAFDGRRRPQPIAAADLAAQIRRVGDAYVLALWYAAGARDAPPEALSRLARAATATHHLRDLQLDLSLGYYNVPAGEAARFGFDPAAFTPSDAAPYIAERAAHVRALFARGRAGLSALPWGRARLLFWLFAARYERLLARIERACASRAVRYTPPPPRDGAQHDVVDADGAVRAGAGAVARGR